MHLHEDDHFEEQQMQEFVQRIVTAECTASFCLDSATSSPQGLMQKGWSLTAGKQMCPVHARRKVMPRRLAMAEVV